jgi:uncharacterized protein
VLFSIVVIILCFQFKIIQPDLVLRMIPVPNSIRILLLFLLQECILIIPILVVVYFRYKKSFMTALSVRRVPFFKSLISVLFWYIVYIIFSIILLTFMDYLGWKIPGYGEGQDILPLFGKDQYTLLVTVLVIVFIAPCIEELFFRGFLFLTLWKTSNYYLATIVSSCIFASVHFDFNAFFPRFLLGLILNHLVKKYDKSIMSSMMFHMMNNGIALTIQLLAQ